MRLPADASPAPRRARRWRVNQNGRWVSEGRAVRYLARVNTRRLPVGARVAAGHTAGKGRGLFATTSLEPGDAVLDEAPLCAEVEDGEEETCRYCKKWLSGADVLASLELGERVRLPGYDAFLAQAGGERPLPTPCRGGCGAQYCGEPCERRAWREYHQVLCPRRVPGVRAFNSHAIGERHGFRLAAQVVARVLVRHLARRAKGASPADALKGAWAPFSSAFRGVWWDVPEPAAVRTEMREGCGVSVGLLRRAVRRFLPLDDGYAAALFTVSTFSSILSSFELNNLDVFVPSPLHQYLHWYEALRRPPRKVAAFQGLSAVAPARGTAFYALQSCANHSCAPNAEAHTDVGAARAGCHLRALRHIAPGEEITISYIDTEQPTAARQADLASYGFVCRCERCTE